MQATQPDAYQVQFSVDYPGRDLDRVSSALRIFWVIPIAIILASVSGTETYQYGEESAQGLMLAAGGTLFLGPLLMILFRQKYPRWWFDWNLQLQRFGNRVGA